MRLTRLTTTIIIRIRPITITKGIRPMAKASITGRRPITHTIKSRRPTAESITGRHRIRAVTAIRMITTKAASNTTDKKEDGKPAALETVGSLIPVE